MSATTPPKKDIRKSRSSPKSPSGREKKKQKREPLIISDPSAMVTFLIGAGDNPTKFLIHKDIACHQSKILKAAFNSEFIEGQTQTYRLDDISDGAFRLFIAWLYFQKLELFQTKPGWIQDAESVEVEDEEDINLAELWVLADKLCMPALQNLVLKEMESIRKRTHAVPTLTFHYVDEFTSLDSQLRKYHVACCLAQLGQSEYQKHPDRFPARMLIDIVCSLTLAIHDGSTDVTKIKMSEFYVSEENM